MPILPLFTAILVDKMLKTVYSTRFPIGRLSAWDCHTKQKNAPGGNVTAGIPIPNPLYKSLILAAAEDMLLEFAAERAADTMRTSSTKLMDFLCQVAEFRPLVALTAIEPRAPSYKRLDDWQRHQVLFNAASFHPLAVLRALRSQPGTLELDATQRLAARQVAMQHLGFGVRIDEEPGLDLTDIMLVIDSRLSR